MNSDPKRGPFEGRRIAVVGLGRNGAPVADALASMGAEVRVWDDNAAALEKTRHKLLMPPYFFEGYAALVLSPGIPHALPKPHPAAEAARRAGVPIVSDAELLYVATRRLGSRARFVGVTGTNGKSTTTALLAHMLEHAGWDSAAGGNLGTSALALPRLGDEGVYVLEMSSYMLERTPTLMFDVACLLNLSPDHLERHGSMEGYVAAKRHVFDRQGPGETAVVGIDDAATRAVGDALAGPRVVRISGSERADCFVEDGVLKGGNGEILAVREAPALPGWHNHQNMAAAAAMAASLGLGREAIAAGIQSFRGLAHRLQRVVTIDGVDWVNDSKATNADAAGHALGIYERVVWIAGGQAKAGGIDGLAPLFGRVAHALLIGRDGPLLSSALRAAKVPFTLSGTLDAAVATARTLAPRLGVQAVLLSPACASFDQFASFEARGERFATLARAAAGSAP